MSQQTVKFDNIKNYKSGWLFGDFEPSLFKVKNVEVAAMFFKKGFRSDNHFHAIAKEFNLVISGSCLVRSSGAKHRLYSGDIFIFEPGVKTDVEYTEDTHLLVIKTPSLPNDKHWDTQEQDDGA